MHDTKDHRTESRGARIGPRVFILSMLFAPACVYWARAQSVDRIFSLMIPPVVLTLLLVVSNVPLRRLAPRLALTQTELVLFYAMQAILCAVSSEWVDNTVPYTYSYAMFGMGNSSVEKGILPHVSPLLFFMDRTGLEDFSGGGKSFAFATTRLAMWWPKIAAWTVLLSLVCAAMLCINSLMRDQWANRERLAFPVLQLPIAITRDGGAGPIWRSRYMWVAFGVMFGVDMLNGLAFFYPALPRINVRFVGDVARWFPNRPWSDIGWTPIGVFPYLSAIGLFMPTDLLFSCVFFFFFRKAQQVLLSSMGYEQGYFGGGGLLPSPPYSSEQSWGAFIGLALMAMWVSRSYLRGVWSEIVSGRHDDTRLVPHRVAFLGLLLSIAALGAFGVRVGLPFGFVVAYALAFLIFSIALTKLRAQLGPPLNEMALVGPNQLIVNFSGTQSMPASLVARWITALHFMNRIHRTHPMPHQLESIKLAELHGVSQRSMFGGILLATVLGIALGGLCQVYIGYRLGATNAAWDTPSMVSELTNTPRPPNFAAISAIMAGFGLVMLLDTVRFRIPGFMLHPAGYALSMNFGIDYIWFGLMIVLAVKVFVQRYYGLKGYEKLRMAALGIILAEYVAEAIWSGIAMVTREATYSVSINGRLIWNE
jgi:hypothetical protein